MKYIQDIQQTICCTTCANDLLSTEVNKNAQAQITKIRKSDASSCCLRCQKQSASCQITIPEDEEVNIEVDGCVPTGMHQLLTVYCCEQNPTTNGHTFYVLLLEVSQDCNTNAIFAGQSRAAHDLVCKSLNENSKTYWNEFIVVDAAIAINVYLSHQKIDIFSCQAELSCLKTQLELLQQKRTSVHQLAVSV